MDKERLQCVVSLIERDRDVMRARAYLALEIGHEKARAQSMRKKTNVR